MAATVARRIGELLVDAGLLSQSQLEQALFAQRKEGRKLGQLLIELGLVNEVQLTQALSRQLAVPWVSLYHVDFSRALLSVVSRETAEKYGVIPIFVRREGKQGETLFVAMDDPTNDAALEEVARASSLPVKPMIACPSDIRAAIRVYYLGEGTLAAVPSGAPAPERAPVPLPVPAPAPEPLPAAAPASALEPSSAPASLPPPPSSRPPPSARTLSLTLLDGTRISIPPRGPKRPARGDDASEGDPPKDQLTARDLVSALRAVAHGVDASDVLGAEPRWEVLFSALLSILLRKGLIADWEFVEEFRKG
jgi:type IV pilus assembly protein PilB